MKRCKECADCFDSETWQCTTCGYAPETRDGSPLLAPDLEESGARYPRDAFAELVALEDRNFWFRARNRLIVWGLRRFFGDMRHYLEIGCGTGYVLSGVEQAFSHAKLVGSEVCSAGLAFARSRVANVELVQMDGRRIPYVDEFDVIGAFDVLEHVDEDQQVLEEMLKAVRPGGGIILTVPQHRWLWSGADEYAGHVRRYRTRELREKVLRAGFQVKFETSFVSLLLPAMIVSRWKFGREKRRDVAKTGLDLPPVLNRLLEMVMELESVMIRAGIRFPLGGSVMLVARKATARQ